MREVLDTLPGLDVLVVGDVLLDEYLEGSSDRICREAPVPVVTVDRRSPHPGGAGNAAANVAALGARVRLLSVVGDDAAGGTLCGALASAGVDLAHVLVEPGRRTVAKRRVVSGHQMVARFDEGFPTPLAAETRAGVVDRLAALFPTVDVVVVSDYGYGVADDVVVDALADLQRRSPRVLVVDAREVTRFRRVGATVVKPNFEEVRPLLPALDGDRAAAVSAARDRLHEATGSRVVAVTLDRDGAVVCEPGRPAYRTWTGPVPASRACGAGDSFAVAFGLALAGGADVPLAAEVAQAAAAVVTARDGTSTCSLDDLRHHLAATATPLEPLEELVERVAFHRRQGRRVVFTNGFFDLLHRGHIDLLHRAKAQGDVLVVGLNSDDSIRRLLGPDRPVNRLEDRASVLSGLSVVDHLVAFDAPTAVELVRTLRPDVYVKGGDYTAGMAPEAAHVEAYGGAVQILPYVEDRTRVPVLSSSADQGRER